MSYYCLSRGWRWKICFILLYIQIFIFILSLNTTAWNLFLCKIHHTEIWLISNLRLISLVLRALNFTRVFALATLYMLHTLFIFTCLTYMNDFGWHQFFHFICLQLETESGRATPTVSIISIGDESFDQEVRKTNLLAANNSGKVVSVTDDSGSGDFEMHNASMFLGTNISVDNGEMVFIAYKCFKLYILSCILKVIRL